MFGKNILRLFWAGVRLVTKVLLSLEMQKLMPKKMETIRTESDNNNDVPCKSLERKKRKRKDRNRTTAKRLQKKKEKEGNNKLKIDFKIF